MKATINKEKLASMVIDDPATGQYKYKRAIFTDEELFELEMKQIGRASCRERV